MVIIILCLQALLSVSLTVAFMPVDLDILVIILDYIILHIPKTICRSVPEMIRVYINRL